MDTINDRTPRRLESGDREAAPRDAGPAERLGDLRRSLERAVAEEPYRILGALCGLGLAVGLRQRGLQLALRSALRSGLDSALDAVLGRGAGAGAHSLG